MHACRRRYSRTSYIFHFWLVKAMAPNSLINNYLGNVPRHSFIVRDNRESRCMDRDAGRLKWGGGGVAGVAGDSLAFIFP